jgi:3-hydroxyisobutyrate dehydrogenase-like beta-hydroxyacid dehydrogenase
MKEKIGVVGLGIMGSGVARSFLKAGHPVTVYNRTRQKAEELGPLGAKIAENPAELARQTDVAIILIWDFPALEQVTLGPDGLLQGAHRGQVFVDMSTQLPKTALWEQKLYEEKGAAFLDAPVHGTRGEANSGGLWLMAGGEKPLFDKMIPLFKVISKTQHYMGPVGMGFSAKLCGNLFVSSVVAALAEALGMAAKAGVPVDELITLWGESDFRSPLIEGFGRAVLARDFSVSFHLRTMVKDTCLIKDFAEDLGMPVPISGLVHELYKIGVNKGLGEENASAIAKVVEDLGGTRIES